MGERFGERLVIAGASSLLGGELKVVLEESRFASWDFRLVDEEDAAGTLTEAGGEAAIIQSIEEGTFHGARYVFLTGSGAFGKRCLGPAREAGATIIDFTRASLSDPDAVPWFPEVATLTGKSLSRKGKTFSVFSSGGMAVASLALALRPVELRRLVVVMHQPVSEAGREGIEELETQTSQLLSFQAVGDRIFGVQAAFNLLPRFGAKGRQDLEACSLTVRAEVTAVLEESGLDDAVSLNLVHAPVFYGMTFSACADLGKETDRIALGALCRQSRFALVGSREAAPSNVSVAGEAAVFLREPQADAVRKGAWWFWGAADNLRVPAWNGCKLAEWLEGS